MWIIEDRGKENTIRMALRVSWWEILKSVFLNIYIYIYI